jgi:hypothetical protein
MRLTTVRDRFIYLISFGYAQKIRCIITCAAPPDCLGHRSSQAYFTRYFSLLRSTYVLSSSGDLRALQDKMRPHVDQQTNTVIETMNKELAHFNKKLNQYIQQ